MQAIYGWQSNARSQYLTVPGDIDPFPTELRTTHLFRMATSLCREAQRSKLDSTEKEPLLHRQTWGQQQYWGMG